MNFLLNVSPIASKEFGDRTRQRKTLRPWLESSNDFAFDQPLLCRLSYWETELQPKGQLKDWEHKLTDLSECISDRASLF